MPNLRLAEQMQWSDAAAKKPTGLWGCWECGFEESYVRDVDKDAEHVRVRLRECTRCGARWETEEKRIGKGSFMARAERRRYARFRKKRYTSRLCLVCEERYMSGHYREHTQTSEAHKIRVAVKQRRIIERERKYHRLHARAAREVKLATRGTAVCGRCGERYDLSVPFPTRTHRGTSPVHREVIAQEANARRDRQRQRERRWSASKREEKAA
jgi:transcription elongation factor Elf1